MLVTLQRYLSHPDPRVRAYANQVKDHNEQRRQEFRKLLEAEHTAEPLLPDGERGQPADSDRR